MGHPELSSSSHGASPREACRGHIQRPVQGCLCRDLTHPGLFPPGSKEKYGERGSSATSADPFPGSSTVSIFHHLAFLSDAVCLFYRYQSTGTTTQRELSKMSPALGSQILILL